MINIQIVPQYEKLVEASLLDEAALATLNEANITLNVELTIAIDTDDTLQQLNHQFLGVNVPTDVLSFPADEFDPDGQIQYIGDVIISYPRAQQQAAKAGHTVNAEIQLLVVHGVLHLLGYDHQEILDKKRMWTVQESILNRLECNLNQLPD